MKTLLKITVTLALPVIYFIIASAFKPTEPLKVTDASKVNLIQPPTAQIPKDFTHFILNYGIQDGDNEWDNFTAFWPYYKDTLHYNGIQLYDYGADTTGQFGVPLRTDQIATVNSLITGTQNRGLRSNFQRINISKLCQDGQRMVFESEGGNEGYSYSSRMSGSGPVSDSGRSVIKGCASCPPSMPAGMLCESITENLQFALSYTYDWAPQQDWHLKPVMRIDSSIVDNSPTAPVIAIVTRNFSGTVIDSTVIKARNFASFLGGNYIYNGQYISTFDFIQDPNTDLDILGRKDTVTGLMYGYTRENVNASQIDFKIYWFGQVDVWFDKLVVDNDIADRLFSENNNFNPFIYDEVNNFGNSLDMFFVDECVTTNLPCIKYVNDYIKNSGLPSPPLSYAVSYNMNFHYTRNDANTFKLYLDTVKPDIIQVDAHALQFHDQGEPGCIPINSFNPLLVDPKVPADWKVNNQTYNTYLQECLGQKDSYVWPMEGSFIYQIHKTRINITSASNNTRISIQPQIQGWLIHNNITGKYRYGVREPINEEISAQAWIALSYGADYLSWFWLPTMTPLTAELSQRNGPPDMSLDPGDETYTFGVFNTPSQPRRQNQYGQNKFDYLCEMNSKILNLKPTLDAISWNSAYSVHSEGANHGYIQDIMSILPGINGQNPCVEDNPNGPYMDCREERFWEMGFYNDVGSAKYFIMVNRRCIPAGGSYTGDNRVLRVKFNLTGPINWQISEVGSSVRPKVFDRTKYASFGENPGEMGWFEPGEGKLFKIEPAINSGGELVEDEIINGGEFTCEAPVYNNGFNITIGANTTIHFNDSSKFVMDGGMFTVGDQNTSAPQNITSDAVSGSSWSGHSFTNCEVKIYGATFTGLANDTTYAVNIIDCPVVDIRNCTFNTNSSLKGSINAVFFSDPNNELSLSNIYIGANTFNSSSSTIPTVNISSYAGETTPLIIENNIFNEGNTAIFLSGLTGGAIKGNAITDNFIGINALTSAIDIKSNTISSTVNNAIGIFAAGGSELKMNNAGSKSLGGLNDISNSGTAANNIVVDGSVFLLDGGQNIFNITDDQSSKHLYGYFPQFTQGPFDETNNCFKLNSTPVDPPYNMVTSGFQGSQITFNFVPYLTGCDPNQNGDGLAINLGDGIYDTIYNEGSGSGGSMKEALPLSKGSTPENSGGRGSITHYPLLNNDTIPSAYSCVTVTTHRQKQNVLTLSTHILTAFKA
ncbi:MAG: right-handed parallel beta-helix repeat-containing protein [Ignavibacteria bacterium]|nr:right-handed parallel beta-helix repeat-containing protein [Ignavibacteria bacterium]